MPKAGSGFRRAAGNAAKAIFGRGGSRDWTLGNVREGVESVQGLYGRTYRNGDVTYQYDGRGQLKDLQVSDRFIGRAEALAKQLAGDVRVIDREAERQYNAMSRWARGISASAQEREEFQRTSRGEMNFSGRGRSGGDAAEAARQMAGLGLIGHDVAGMGNNVDIMNAINDAMNAVKSQIRTGVSGKAAQDFEGDIFEGLISRYEGVVKGANRRRRS